MGTLRSVRLTPGDDTIGKKIKKGYSDDGSALWRGRKRGISIMELLSCGKEEWRRCLLVVDLFQPVVGKTWSLTCAQHVTETYKAVSNVSDLEMESSLKGELACISANRGQSSRYDGAVM